ncbi:MAG: cobalamin biosynthesis protein CbiD [Mogibacterium sp.]|nr:cobalamin biosynthesis protein CbiD [Mogibacterium sp.]
MRSGFTTGSCAAAAAKAACQMLLTGQKIHAVRIMTPRGIPYDAEILDITIAEDAVSCAVRKDGGEDPDITTGLLIYAEAAPDPGIPEDEIRIDGGSGIGRVTRPGLDQPVGEAAINSVPREMIRNAVDEVRNLCGYTGGICISVSAPGGEELARKTFNPRLGIEGGISIIGTSGIVEPMSTQAILDTIRVELRQRRAEGYDTAWICPGNYGQRFLLEQYGVDLDRSVKCSNFIGQTVDMAVELGFRRMLLAGHAGKLVKVAGGIMNTHSREADCRMELIEAAALQAGVPTEGLRAILDCVTTEEAFRTVEEHGKLREVSEILLEQILKHLRKRCGDALQVECMLYTNERGSLAASSGALRMMEEADE